MRGCDNMIFQSVEKQRLFQIITGCFKLPGSIRTYVIYCIVFLVVVYLISTYVHTCQLYSILTYKCE